MDEFLDRMEVVISSAGEVLESESINEQLLMTHFDRVLNVLRRLPNEPNEVQSTKLQALEVLHGLAVHLIPSRNQFRPLATQAIRYCLLALGHGICPIRIGIYELIATLAEVVGNEMCKVYPVVNGQMEHDIVHPNCTFLERAVLDTLRIFAEDTGSAFTEHLQKAFEITCGSIHNRDPGVRIASIKALCSFVVAFQIQDCTTQAQRAYKSLVPTFACILRRDKRMLVVRELSLGLCQVFHSGLPPRSLSDREVADPIFECIKDLMAKRMACQQDEPEHLDDLPMCGANILACYGRALDPDLFVSYFEELHGSFVQFLQETPAENRSEFYGMIDDCIENLCCRAVPYHGFLLTLLLDGFVEQDPESRQNAYYGIGQLVSQVGQTAVKNYPEILKALLHASTREQPGAARDNVVGALARMIVANFGAVPLDQVLPRFMSCLPLTADFSENQSVLLAFRMLYDNAHARVMPFIGRMLLTSIRILLEKRDIDPECIRVGEAFVEEIRRTYPAKFKNVYMKNPEVKVYMMSIFYRQDEDQLEH